MPRLTSKGKCSFCGSSFAKGAMVRHLQACKQRAGIAAASEPSGNSFHLLVEGRYQPEYWMHLAVPADESLESLDSFLRATWLECCGYLSSFNIAGVQYAANPVKDFGVPDFSVGMEEESMDVTLGSVLSAKMRFYHEYDYGTTTELTLRVAGMGKALSREIEVLARNDPPELACQDCGATAIWIDTESGWQDEGLLCAECVSKGDYDEDMLLPVVNSPRMGMCGYEG